jgi:hypothetical protein
MVIQDRSKKAKAASAHNTVDSVRASSGEPWANFIAKDFQ